MTDAALVAFLEWAVPRLGLRWKGLRSFRKTVRKRLTKRLAELGLDDLGEYRAHLDADGSEWKALEAMCRIPISRLYRDREVWGLLATKILPARAETAEREGRRAVRIWSAGCASGEEPYSAAIVWHVDVGPRHPRVALEILATDADEEMIDRAQRGCYGEGSLRELPARLREVALQREGERFALREALRAGLTFRRQDLRHAMPDGMFDVILCRNMLLTYLDESLHRTLVERLIARLLPGGTLVVGSRETMPADLPAIEAEASSEGGAAGVFTARAGQRR